MLTEADDGDGEVDEEKVAHGEGVAEEVNEGVVSRDASNGSVTVRMAPRNGA